MPKIFKVLSKISAKVFLYLFIASSLICIFSLRHNNQQMVKLRDAVYAADKDNKDVNTALNNLRGYVYGHMNTDLSSGGNNIKPPIQLKYTYQRLVEARQNQLQADNQQIYADAQRYCVATNNTAFDSPCVQNYVVNHGVKQADVNIPPGLYQFDFISPSWSPDLAGWSLLASIIFLVAFVFSYSLPKLKDRER